MPRPVEGVKVRDRGPDDEYAQATLFWNSMSEIEQDHIVDAFTFELGHVEVPAVVERMVTRLTLVDTQLAARICIGLGLPAPLPPEGTAADAADAGADGGSDLEPGFVPDATGGLQSSPTLAMITADVFPVDGRVVQILANDRCDLNGIRALQAALLNAGATPHVVATHKGAIAGRKTDELTVDRSFHTASSAEADAFIVADGAGLADNPAVITWIQSAYRHFKPIAAWGDGAQLLANAGVPSDAPGVVVSQKANSTFAKAVIASMSVHRHWDRAAPHPTRALTGETV
jgi:catalase